MLKIVQAVPILFTFLVWQTLIIFSQDILTNFLCFKNIYSKYSLCSNCKKNKFLKMYISIIILISVAWFFVEQLKSYCINLHKHLYAFINKYPLE